MAEALVIVAAGVLLVWWVQRDWPRRLSRVRTRIVEPPQLERFDAFVSGGGYRVLAGAVTAIGVIVFAGGVALLISRL